jgi:RimJ/RimL family protein N-acetyltransferase
MSVPFTVGLRAETAEDEDLLYRLQSDLDSWEERSPSSPAPLSLRAFQQRRADAPSSADVEFIVTVDGVAVGRATLFGEDALARNAEVGIALLPEARGKGVGTEALAQLVEFGFVRRNLHRLHLRLISSNAAAIAAYRKAGFVEEGRHREHCWVRGGYEDEITMGLLRAEWQATR